MNTSHITHTFRKFFFGALFFAMLGLVPSLANVVFDGSPGTAAPPTTLGPYTMTPFGLDNVNPVNPFGPNIPNTTSVATPALACGGAVTFNPQLDHRRVPTSWNTWSHGYAGDVYDGGAGANATITITLPAGTGAFYFYAMTNLGGTYSIKADANDGTTSGPISVAFTAVGANTARYFGFYAAPGCALTTITITNVTGGSSVAIGEFGMACQTALNQVKVSDQKAGSILVYPYYTSNAQTKADTRITLTNLAGTLNPLPGNLPAALAGGTIYVHVFFLNGANCAPADMYVCLTKGASLTFNASTQDPDITGYVIAVAVNEMGRPVSWNNLIGNAFVSTPEVSGNYGAESFAALAAPGARTEAGTGDTARLGLNSIAYDRGANQFAVEIQSPVSAPGQTVVHASVDGNIAGGSMSGVTQAGTGLVVRGDEKQGSFVNFLGGGCLSSGAIRVDRPRVPTGMGAFISAGQIGTMVYNTSVGSVGLLLSPKANAWGGIRTLHKTRTVDSFLNIPVFMPVC